MFKNMIEKIIGNYSDRELKRLMPIVEQVDGLEEAYKKLSEAELKGKTAEFKARLKDGETLDDILPEAFATVREASGRVLGMRHFSVQILGGLVLHQGRISEMKTGEGKTLVATLPAYLNALTEKGVHIVTVNDYLAKRDSEWMGKLYKYLGLSVGLVIHDIDPDDRKLAYQADITYGTNNEFGFDYLRDNMVIYKEMMVQRGHHFAIVDEVDSILIDEARTPLIISGMGDKSSDLYERADRFAKSLRKKVYVEVDSKQYDEEQEDPNVDYIVHEKEHAVTLTQRGIKKAEEYFGVENLSDPENMTLSHHINQAIRANGIMKLDKDYVVKDGEIIIVDEFTGRLMVGRRYNEGLHQAIEAKENVKVAHESRTLATITFQNYFRLYEKLSGMTGTARTEEEEFQDIYKLDVIEIPTNQPMIRIDADDAVYKNETGKFGAIIQEITEAHKTGQPILVGTVTIENSEKISAMLKKNGIKHEVLNAKFHEKEAEIIAQAGKKGAVTIATNMAGRGTDIMLGGNAEYAALQEMRKQGFEEHLMVEATGHADTDDEEILNARKAFRAFYEKHQNDMAQEKQEVKDLGGLYIIGTERHESRRIDNQLRGRAGRQGDPGRSKFFISLEDDLMRLFGGDRMTNMVNALGLEDDQPIEARMLSSQIENAQKRVEGKNFQIRKHVLQFDDVMNQQREVIYGQRQKVLNGEDIQESIQKMMSDTISHHVDMAVGTTPHPDDWNFDLLREWAYGMFVAPGTLEFTRDELEDLTKDRLINILQEEMDTAYARQEEVFGENMRELERVILLQVVDMKWMTHLDEMDRLRQSVNLRAYGQHDPIVEYKFEGYNMFEEMVAGIADDTTKYILTARPQAELKREQVAKPTATSRGGDDQPKKPVVKGEKTGRNDPCPCGSGKKYKKCCGQ